MCIRSFWSYIHPLGDTMKIQNSYKQGSVWRVRNGEMKFVGGGRPARSQTGYGGKIATDYKTEIPMKNSKGMIINKLYRVYACQYSNLATLYVVVKNKNYVLDNT